MRRKNKDERIFSLESRDQRRSFRVRPLSTAPIDLNFGDKNVGVTDIGGAGIAFPNDGFMVGDFRQVSFTLPEEEQTISVGVKIVDIDKDGICHCSFSGLNEQSLNAIHRYMLRVQVRRVRKRKKSLNEGCGGDDPVCGEQNEIEPSEKQVYR